MDAALDAVTSPVTASTPLTIAPEVVGEMRDYFVRAADHLRNV